MVPAAVVMVRVVTTMAMIMVAKELSVPVPVMWVVVMKAVSVVAVMTVVNGIIAAAGLR